MLRFGSFVGFEPPYFSHRELRERLHRAAMPLAGEPSARSDRIDPPAHGEVYAGSGASGALAVIDGAGHAVHLEHPERVADLIAAIP